ncbi:MAG TPA: acyl-CoA dehydrogenase family protein [Acidimicrobiales bacterium]|jgi:alkylation response protein AidB-like acyl-CoA dehydrogenase
MNFDDSAEDAEFRRQVSAWLADHARLRTGLDDWSRDHEHPDYVKRCREWQYSLYEGGWGAITWPAEYGGRGESSWHQTIFNQEAVKYDVSVGAFAVGIGMCGPTLIAHGSEEQKQQHLGAMLRGEEVWCQLFSEPDAGSDLAGLKTRAQRDGDQFVVNGQKVWTSGAQHSDWAILIARTNPDVPKHKGITYFLVDMRTPGIEVRPLRQITGFAHFNEVFLTDVAVPVENVVGTIDNGWAVTHTTLANERTLIGGAGQGITADQVLDLARRLGGSRDPLIRQHVAAFYTRIQLLRFMNYRVQTALSHGRQPGPEAATTKLLVSQHMSLTGDLLMELVGANGMLANGSAVDSGAWETAFLNQWMSKLGGGTDNIQRNSLGERVLGLPREPRTDKDVPFSALA